MRQLTDTEMTELTDRVKSAGSVSLSVSEASSLKPVDLR